MWSVFNNNMDSCNDIIESNEPFYVRIKSKIINQLKEVEKYVTNNKVTVILDDLGVSYPHLYSFLKSKGYNVIVCKNKCSSTLYQTLRCIMMKKGTYIPQSGLNTKLLIRDVKYVVNPNDALLLVHPLDLDKHVFKYMDIIKSLNCKVVILLREAKSRCEYVAKVKYRDKLTEICTNIDEYKYLLNLGLENFVKRKLKSILSTGGAENVAVILKVLCDGETTTGELYIKLLELKKKIKGRVISMRTMQDYIQQLKSSKIIKVETKSFGRYGRTSIIKINPQMKEIVEKYLKTRVPDLFN